MSYEVIENEISANGEKRTSRVQISNDETIYLNFSIEPSQERVDAEVERFLANRDLIEAQRRLDAANDAVRSLS